MRLELASDLHVANRLRAHSLGRALDDETVERSDGCGTAGVAELDGRGVMAGEPDREERCDPGIEVADRLARREPQLELDRGIVGERDEHAVRARGVPATDRLRG